MWTELTRALWRAQPLHWMLWMTVIAGISVFAPGPAAVLWSIALWSVLFLVVAVGTIEPWTPEANRLFNWICNTGLVLLLGYVVHTMGAIL